MPVSVTDLAGRLPDLPRLVETRAILLSGACEILGDTDGGHYVVRSLETRLAAVVGRPSPGPLRDTAARDDVAEILCGEEAVRSAAAALRGWQADPAAIHVLGTARPARPEGTLEVRLVGAGEPLSLAHVPDELRQELESTRRRSPLAVGFVEGRAVSFACAPWQTETLFDLSIDTLDPHRGRGLAAAVAALLIDAVSATGRQPVWGALEDNGPSLRLAARLGFVPVDRLFVLSRRD